jgi:hypothetical protein
MEENKALILGIVGVAMAVLIVFLIWKNQKDKKAINPDAQDATEETRMDQERKSNRL